MTRKEIFTLVPIENENHAINNYGRTETQIAT